MRRNALRYAGSLLSGNYKKSLDSVEVVAESGFSTAWLGTTGDHMRGHCLCGKVEFEIDGDRFNLYQCHCSLCRRQGGSLSNAATIVSNERFRWHRGAEHISSWKKESGFRSDFCSACGSPVPNPIRSLPYFWVPAGLLEGGGRLEIVAHLYVASKASWDSTPLQGACHDELPNLSEFIALLHAADA